MAVLGKETKLVHSENLTRMANEANDETIRPNSPARDLAPVRGTQTTLVLDVEAFMRDENPAGKVNPKPKVKMFDVPVGGEVIMPTGEILKISVFFPADVIPARVGVYVTKQDDNVIDSEAPEDASTVGFSHWNGEHWGPQFQTPDSASANHGAAKWPLKPWAALVEEHPDNQI